MADDDVAFESPAAQKRSKTRKAPAKKAPDGKKNPTVVRGSDPPVRTCVRG